MDLPMSHGALGRAHHATQGEHDPTVNQRRSWHQTRLLQLDDNDVSHYSGGAYIFIGTQADSGHISLLKH